MDGSLRSVFLAKDVSSKHGDCFASLHIGEALSIVKKAPESAVLT